MTFHSSGQEQLTKEVNMLRADEFHEEKVEKMVGDIERVTSEHVT